MQEDAVVKRNNVPKVKKDVVFTQKQDQRTKILVNFLKVSVKQK